MLDAYKTSSMNFGGDASWLFTLKSLEFGEGGTPISGDGEYVLADAIESGKTYVIVADGAFALNNQVANFGSYSDGDATLGSTAVTIAGEKITSDVTVDMLWTINSAEGVQAAIDGRDQYFIFDQSGKQLLRRSGSTSTAPFSVGTMDASKPQYATFSVYQRADGSYTVYVNSYRDSDYPFTLSGSAQGFNAPGVARSTWEGQIETYQSSIRFYTKSEGQTPIPADLTALNEAIAAAEAVDKSKYTDETVAALDAAVAAGKALTADDA